MKIVITAGGTTEKVDKVRSITNISTGKLGSLIAEAFYSLVPNIKIIYICSYNAVVPNVPDANIINVTNTLNLQETLENILKTEEIDAVIHSMAVSDYSVSGISNLEETVSSVTKKIYNNKEILQDYETIYNLIYNEVTQNKVINKEVRKISSSVDNLLLFMEKTPKIINKIKKLQPKVILVGFKLLVGVDEEELLKVGHNQLIKNNCDFVLANNLNNITKDYHKGILISPDLSYIHLNTKQEIAKAVTNNVLLKIRGEEK